MLEIVLWFAFITAIGEFVILHHLNPRFRRWILSSPTMRNGFHVSFAMLNLWIHWGTMTGSMTAVTAYIISVAVLFLARIIYVERSSIACHPAR